jgi:hypothetical protein
VRRQSNWQPYRPLAFRKPGPLTAELVLEKFSQFCALWGIPAGQAEAVLIGEWVDRDGDYLDGRDGVVVVKGVRAGGRVTLMVRTADGAERRIDPADGTRELLIRYVEREFAPELAPDA